MTCDQCGETLVRCIVEWEDGSASVVWRCACELDNIDLKALERGPVATLACAVVAYPAADDALGTRGWA